MLKHLPAILIVISLVCRAQAADSIESAFDWQTVRSGQVLVRLHNTVEVTRTESVILTGRDDFDAALTQIGACEMSQPAPDHQPDLYLVEFDPTVSVEDAAAILESTSLVEEATPRVLLPWSEMVYYPDDFLMPVEWHLEAVSAPSAWTIFRGADSIEVAIVDGGVNYVHPDLADNIWINRGEDLNGNRIIEPSEIDSIDNDGNGYIDDFWGWDWIDLDSAAVWPGEDPGPPDNDPSDFDGHGTHCAGDACAATDNGIGVASPGFNCRIMALRAGYLSVSGQGYVDLLAAMQAVYYAVANGAEVISMSFGGPGYISWFYDALNYANTNGLVLVAAAGNESTSAVSYPAGYDVVIAVAATAQGDVLADFTNYGDWITLCAPGEGIYSTLIEGYGNMSGTSMACPVTAGVAAAVKALMPEWNSVDVGLWLSFTADNIDAQNPGYVGMMGGGRLNEYKALDLFVSIDSLWVDDGQGGDRLIFDQDGSLYVRYHKFFGDANNVSLTLSSDNSRVSFPQNYHYIGDLTTGQSGDNSADPFVVNVTSAGADFEIVQVEAEFVGDGFEFTQILDLPVGRAQVLIIDADQNNDQRTAFYYEDALDQLGLSHETLKRSTVPALGGDLSRYDAVIHFSGTAETDIFPGDDWENLENYLNDGGSLLLTGQNVAEDLAASQPDILSDVLHVEYLEPSSGILTVRGVEGNPLTEGMYLVMAGSGGAWNQNSMDVVSALPGAEPFFIYRTTEPDELAGVRVQDGDGDLFFCAYGIEGINDSTSSGNTKQEVLEMVFNAFGVTAASPANEAHQPSSVTLFPPYPNPFNGQMRLTYFLPVPAEVTVRVYDLMGRMILSELIPRGNAGYRRWNWSVPPDLASGIYLVQLRASGNNYNRKVIVLK